MANFLKSLIVKGNVTAEQNLISSYSSGDEGGEIQLAKPATNSTISTSVTLDIYQNKLRIFESGGTNRGAYIDLTAATAGVGSNLLSGGGGATTLDGLSDVVITSAASGQIVSYDGTNWVNVDNFSVATKNTVKNDSGGTLGVGSVVYTSGANGTNILVKGARADAESTSATVLGFLESSLAANGIGYVVTHGLIAGVNTGSASAGDPVWLSPSTAGGFVTGLVNKPSSPNHLVYLGTVTRAHATNGEIFVHILNGWELEELHNVTLTSPQSGDFLKYNGSVWVNDPIDLGTDTTGNYMSGISGTSPVSVSHTPAEGSSATVSLASGYGDTQNPFASKTANYILAGPTTGSASAPAFRALVDADIPSALTGKTYNGLGVTTTTGYLSMANGKTLSVSNSLTFAGTDSTTMTFPSTSSTVMTLATPGTLTGTLTLRAGTATAGTAPLYLTSGTNLTVAAAGAVEFDGTNLYFTPSTTRKTVVFTDVTSLSSLATVGTVTSGTISGGSA